MTIDAAAPLAVRELDTMLQACAAWVTAVDDGGNEAAHSHYAQVDLKAAADGGSLPVAVLTDISHSRTPYAAGVAALPGGELRITLHTLAEGIAELESLGRDIAEQLTAQQVGLANLSAFVGLSGEPDPADRVADVAIRSIDIDCTYGLTP